MGFDTHEHVSIASNLWNVTAVELWTWGNLQQEAILHQQCNVKRAYRHVRHLGHVRHVLHSEATNKQRDTSTQTQRNEYQSRHTSTDSNTRTHSHKYSSLSQFLSSSLTATITNTCAGWLASSLFLAAEVPVSWAPSSSHIACAFLPPSAIILCCIVLTSRRLLLYLKLNIFAKVIILGQLCVVVVVNMRWFRIKLKNCEGPFRLVGKTKKER